MAKSVTPVKQVTISIQSVIFTISVYQAAVGYSGKWEGDGQVGSAGFMPTVEDVVALAKLKIEDYLRLKRRHA